MYTKNNLNLFNIKEFSIYKFNNSNNIICTYNYNKYLELKDELIKKTKNFYYKNVTIY